MPKIFICYRREDSTHQAGRLFDRMVAQYSPADVFKDVDSIPLGVDFRKVLEAKVGQCDVLLALVGDQWLTAAKPGGGRRLDDPADFVHIEIETALRRNIPVIPLLVSKASVPAPNDLPPSMAGFAYRHGMALRPDPDFHRDVDRLVLQVASKHRFLIDVAQISNGASARVRLTHPTSYCPQNCRSAFRSSIAPGSRYNGIGFRLVVRPPHSTR
jgi:TIR domain